MKHLNTHLNKAIMLTLTVASLNVFTIGNVIADDDDPAKMLLTAKAAGLISVEQATEKALAAKPGTVIEVELEKRKWPQGWDYEFEIIDAQGNEWDVNIDAKTGETRKVSRDWF
ncbi:MULTISPECIES: PepSY domain-containing protein [Methylotenera]|uniref:PepSY domain-containing protein n=1 Tax=Methylotenera TaxID=359407 RepID=UPI00037451C9|nr:MULTISPECIES: PepSY domain-containing protein [Methylotenera]